MKVSDRKYYVTAFGKSTFKELPKEVKAFVKKNRRFLSLRATYFLLRQRKYFAADIATIKQLDTLLPRIRELDEKEMDQLVKVASFIGLVVGTKQYCLIRYDERQESSIHENAFLQGLYRVTLAMIKEEAKVAPKEPAEEISLIGEKLLLSDGLTVAQLKKQGYLEGILEVAKNSRDVVMLYCQHNWVQDFSKKVMLVSGGLFAASNAVLAANMFVSSFVLGFVGATTMSVCTFVFLLGLASRFIKNGLPKTKKGSDEMFGRIFVLLNIKNLRNALGGNCSKTQVWQVINLISKFDQARADKLAKSFPYGTMYRKLDFGFLGLLGPFMHEVAILQEEWESTLNPQRPHAG